LKFDNKSFIRFWIIISIKKFCPNKGPKRVDNIKERRSRLEIIADILEEAKYGVRKTRIVYRANLNSNQFKKYGRDLVDKGLLGNSTLNGYTLYKTTESGLEVLKNFKKMRRYL